MKIIDYALEYLEVHKFSIIPAYTTPEHKKKAYIKWAKYQQEFPTRDEIIEWWTKWPDAMISAVTGKLSGLLSFDFDTYKLADDQRKKVEDLIPWTISCPSSKTPRGGIHKHFKYPRDIEVRGYVGNKENGWEGFDIRGEGSLVMLPPSSNGDKMEYSWLPRKSIADLELADIDSSLLSSVLSTLKINIYNCKDYAKTFDSALQGVTNRYLTLQEPGRSDSLFHIANAMAKGKMTYENVLFAIKALGCQCSPPMEEKELTEIVKSAFDRNKKRELGVTEAIRDYLTVTTGYTDVTSVEKALQTVTNTNRATIRVAIHRLCKAGIIEKDKNNDNRFRKINTEETEIDFKNACEDYLDIKYPFGIERWFNTAPKNIIMVAGEPDAGKTAFLLNFAGLNNWSSMPIFYFSSEMGDSELKNRLLPFIKPTWKQFRMKVIERSSDFADVIRPDAINIIDFLEIHDEFYKVGLYIKQIFDKLNSGIAVIALQKNPGKDQGLGGMRSIEKARLAINMERGGRLVIDKAKNWATMNNPRGLALDYKLVEGCHFQVINEGNGNKGWYYADGVRQIGAREEKQKQYQQPFNNQF